MPKQELTLEEKRACEVAILFLFYRISDKVSILKEVFAHPFFISGTAWPTSPISFNVFPPNLISSPHATPTMPS